MFWSFFFCNLEKPSQPGVVAHISNPALERKDYCHDFEASLHCILRPCVKKEKNKEKNHPIYFLSP